MQFAGAKVWLPNLFNFISLDAGRMDLSVVKILQRLPYLFFLVYGVPQFGQNLCLKDIKGSWHF